MNLYYEYGTTPYFDFTPSTGSKIQSVIYNAKDVTSNLVGNVYTLPAIISNGLLIVNFVNINTDTPEISGNQLKVYTTNFKIIIEGTVKGEVVRVYNVNGKEIQNIQSQGEKIILTVQHNALYFVKTATKTFKVVL